MAGDKDKGWEIRFRGEDGNFYVRFLLDATDGDGKAWHAETWVIVEGDQLELPLEYYKYKEECDAKYKQWAGLKIALRVPIKEKPSLQLPAQPWGPIANELVREAVAVRTLVRVGDPDAFRRLSAAAEQYGPSILSLIARAPFERQQ